MLIAKAIALLVNKSVPKNSKKLVKSQKFHQKLQKPGVKAKKTIELLDIDSFVPCASIACIWDLSLTEPRYENWIVSSWLKKKQKKDEHF